MSKTPNIKIGKKGKKAGGLITINGMAMLPCPFCGSNPKFIDHGYSVYEDKSLTLACPNGCCRKEIFLHEITDEKEICEILVHVLGTRWNTRKRGRHE